jgi:hypothetical protein
MACRGRERTSNIYLLNFLIPRTDPHPCAVCLACCLMEGVVVYLANVELAGLSVYHAKIVDFAVAGTADEFTSWIMGVWRLR